MNRKGSNTDTETVNEDAIFEAISAGIAAPPADGRRVDRLRSRVFAQLDFDTIRRDDGQWQEILPKVRKKVLQIDEARGIESYLLRVDAGAGVPAHRHESDELCFVIEGDIAFGDVKLQEGDYHFARPGSSHGNAVSERGCLLFLQAGLGSDHHAV